MCAVRRYIIYIFTLVRVYTIIDNTFIFFVLLFLTMYSLMFLRLRITEPGLTVPGYYMYHVVARIAAHCADGFARKSAFSCADRTFYRHIVIHVLARKKPLRKRSIIERRFVEIGPEAQRVYTMARERKI